jgi:hypothetical protein
MSHASLIDSEYTMHLISRRTLALTGLLTTVVFAHAMPASDPANPETSVPAVPYQSAFEHYQAAPEASTSPDKAWRAAIAAVASEPDHGSMAGMNMDGATPMAMPMPSGMKMPMDQHQHMDMSKPIPKPMPKDMPMTRDMKMPMQMPKDMQMPMQMPGQEAAPPMNMHHDHGGAK